MLYSFRGAYPTQLPNRIKLSSGFTRTDKETFTQEELDDSGWFSVPDKPVAEYPKKIDWDYTSKQWVIRSPNDSETAFKQHEIREQCKKLLKDTDYKVVKAIELSELIDPGYIEYRQALRELYNNVGDQDPWFIVYPTPTLITPEV